MARKFIATDIVSPVKARLRADSFTHLNGALDELSNAVIKGLLSSYVANDVIVLNGCVITGTLVAPGPAAITAGQVFYNGRVYEVDAVASLVLAGAQIPVLTIVETFQGGLTTFSDGNDYGFQSIEKVAMTAGLSGSGIKNGSDIKYLRKTKIIPLGNWNMDTTAGLTVAHGLSSVQWLKMRILGVSIIKDNSLKVDILAMQNVTAAGTDSGIIFIDSTNIELSRATGGQFDDPGWAIPPNGNRGFIHVEYGDI